MKKFFTLLLLLSSNIYAQDKVIISSPLNETHIYEFLARMNPDLHSNPEIAKLATEVLKEWAKALVEIEGSLEHTFVQTNEEYVIVCNIWLASAVGDRGVEEMLFDNRSPLIIRNMKEDDLLYCIENSKEAGVSFMRVQYDDPKENVEIFLILLR